MMKNIRLFAVAMGVVVAFVGIVLLNSCRHDKGDVPYAQSGYPTAIAQIIVTKCAVSGCHNAQSYENASGILLDTWDHLFNGSNHGAVVIPYDIENSSLLYFINTDSTLGPVQQPTMPEMAPPLSKDEYMTIRDWIAKGAPDINGNIPFAANPDSRQKIYLTAQGCDLVHVIDVERDVIMRNIKVGTKPTTESPHCLRVSNDGKYAYTCFYTSDYVQKIDTRTDAIVGQALVNPGGATTGAQWNILHMSDDGTKGVVADFNNGILKFFTTADMNVYKSLSGIGLFTHPHGMAANSAFDTIYVTAQYGNVVYKISPNGFYSKVLIDGGPETFTPGTRDPHEIMLTPDGSKYFLTCEASNEVRVMDAHTNQLLAVINTPKKPQELAISKNKNYMLVTCIEATHPDPSRRGAVVVIDYNTLQQVGQPIYGDFFQPHAIAVDDFSGKFYVASTNADPNGPAPHHASSCGGKNGWYSVYDLNTLQPISGRRYETSVLPYSADARFKK